jgi:hypothetical protein
MLAFMDGISILVLTAFLQGRYYCEAAHEQSH